jgi:signal transduction histidine kinase
MKVLRKLKIQMALLSTLLTGVILLLMAVYSFNVAQRALFAQYERDLEQMSRSTRTIMSTLAPAVRVQFASRFVAVYKYGGVAQYMTIGTETNFETLDAVTRKAYDSVSASVAVAGLAAGFQTQGNFLDAPFLFSGLTGRPAFFIADQTISETVLVEHAGEHYRVATTITLGIPETELYVIQSRSEELSAAGQLRMNYLLMALGGLGLVFLSALYLSGRAIRPVETSIGQQRDFVAAASHELRTPVAAIRANAEVLSDADLHDFAPYLNAISLESERMSRLIADLIDLARADAGQWQLNDETVSLTRLTERAYALLSPLAAQKGATLVTQTEDALVKADEERLIQVLTILVDNAIRHGKPQGRISICAYTDDKDAVLGVADDGPGIASEYCERVFERFYRPDPSRTGSGSGLGLSVARRLIEAMHGTLTLSKSDMGGCLFEIRLPVK